jgi:hypothetical protein
MKNNQQQNRKLWPGFLVGRQGKQGSDDTAVNAADDSRIRASLDEMHWLVLKCTRQQQVIEDLQRQADDLREALNLQELKAEVLVEAVGSLIQMVARRSRLKRL